MADQQFVVTIARPVPEVFAFTADMTNLPRWASGPVAAEQTSSGPRGAGTTYRITAKPPVGGPMHSTYTFTDYAENAQFAAEGQFGPIPFRERYVFTAVPSGTRLTQTIRLQPRGLARALQPALRLLLPRLIRSDLRRLKRLLESGSV